MSALAQSAILVGLVVGTVGLVAVLHLIAGALGPGLREVGKDVPFTAHTVDARPVRFRYRLAAVPLAMAVVLQLTRPVTALADGCVSVPPSQIPGNSIAAAREQIGPMLLHLNETQVAVRGAHPTAARVEYEQYLERWDEVGGTVADGFPETCASVEMQMERLDDALLGRVADEDLATSDDALSHLRGLLLGVAHEISIDDAAR